MKLKFFAATGLMVAALALGMFSHPQPAFAAGIFPEPTGKCPEDYKNGTPPDLTKPCADGATRDYALDDIKSQIAIIGNLLLGVSGAIVLAAFVLGAAYWIGSRGDEKMVTQGKSIISGAVIGLIILFSAYTIVIFAVKTLLGSSATDYLPGAVAPTGKVDASGTGVDSSGNVQTIDKKQGSAETPPATTPPASGVCATIGGTCKASESDCAGDSVSGSDGWCTDSAQTCCLTASQPSQQSSCGKDGGTCLDSSKESCSVGFVTGFCDAKGQGANIKCCFKK